jgi:hypothetical protein
LASRPAKPAFDPHANCFDGGSVHGIVILAQHGWISDPEQVEIGRMR